ncbi:DNA adenine methylase [Halorussus ruber]|uniref:DNA adenine methylase n=1 Tax=Halorussus ruber TaxID=1126238 RepID=UPI0010922BC9|nr:DNA adenine methylase [Halorussus ruber]
MASVKPVLKWAGGKSQILHEIVPRLPSDFNHYHEPFFGGGAVFFDLQPPNGTINDLNSRLMNFYRQVRDNHEELIETNKKHQREIDELDDEATEEYYYDKRDEFNSLRQHGLCENEVLEASLLLFLNRTCFNGLYRENQSGKYNVPFGRRTSPDVVREERIRAAHDALQNTDIRNQDFTYVKHVVGEKDAVYFDPPYKPVSETANFDDYLAGGFGADKQRKLRDLAVDLHEKGVYVTISNSPPARQLYEEDDVPDAFEVESITANRSINRNGDDRTGAKEIIVTNVPQHMRQGTLSSFGQEDDA